MTQQPKVSEFRSTVPAPTGSEVCGFKNSTISEVKVEGRKVQAVIGMLGVVDRDNEIIIADSYQIEEVQASRWLHNSMASSKAKGLVREIEQPVAFGKGWVDGNKVIAEVEAYPSVAGDEWLAFIRGGGSMIRYSQGYTMPKVGAKRRDDGVIELHNVTGWEMSPVPDPSAPGTMTLAAAEGMGLGGLPDDFDVREFVREQVRDFLTSDELREALADGTRWGVRDVVTAAAQSQAESLTREAIGAKAADFERWGLTVRAGAS